MRTTITMPLETLALIIERARELDSADGGNAEPEAAETDEDETDQEALMLNEGEVSEDTSEGDDEFVDDEDDEDEIDEEEVGDEELAEILSDLNEEELAQLAALTDRAAPLDIKQVVDGYWLAGRQSGML